MARLRIALALFALLLVPVSSQLRQHSLVPSDSSRNQHGCKVGLK